LKCHVTDFLDALPGKVAQKITWVLKLIEETPIVPKEYLKKLSPYDIWEVRISFSGVKYRIFSFIDDDSRLILTHGIVKKTNKIPKKEIEKALAYKEDYLNNRGWKR
jgi:phage-related protein